MLEEFKTSAMGGNVVYRAVAVVIGTVASLQSLTEFRDALKSR